MSIETEKRGAFAAPPGSAESILARACKPEVGDAFRLGDEVVQVEHVGEHLIDLHLSSGESLEWRYNFQRNRANWERDVKKTLIRGAVFMPNIEVRQ